jgi:hypothetical protein
VSVDASFRQSTRGNSDIHPRRSRRRSFCSRLNEVVFSMHTLPPCSVAPFIPPARACCAGYGQ